MTARKNFLDRFTEKIEDLDPGSRQAYVLRLIRERGFFETVFNAVEEGILVIDRFLKIRYFNRAAREMLGLPEDLSSLRLSQLLRDVDWRRLLREDEEEWARVARQELELTYPEHRVLQFCLIPYAEGGGLATVILRDITEMREREREHLDTEKTQAISMLAASVAHEIGNPLNSLYLNLQLLERTFAAPAVDLADARTMLDECMNEVERLDHLIEAFLQALRPGGARFEPVALPELIVETLTFMRQEILARGVDVRCEWPESAPPKIRGRAPELKQMFFNLIKNALQAMSSGGELAIRCAADADYVYLLFDDTGKGILPGVLSEMFKPFKSFKPGGSGIGMMIVERVCREHGALLSLDSKPGEGTAISIRFPLREKQLRVLPRPEDD